MTMQKEKGKSFENKTAKFIHEYLFKNNEDYRALYETIGNVNVKPRREKSSGTAKDSDNDIDLGIALKFFPYSVECKHHKVVTDFTLNAIIDNKLSWLEKVFKQAETHGNAKNLTPLIVFRGNYTVDFCAIKINEKEDILNKVYKNKVNHIIYKDCLIASFKEMIPFLVV